MLATGLRLVDPPDEERGRLESLLGDLQQQATTGSGAWEQSLRQATDAASASASALGQMQGDTSMQSQLRNIGNAQAGAEQRAVGQGNILRAKQQQQAQGR